MRTLAVVILGAVFLAACSGGGGGDDQSEPVGTGTDEDYLRAICVGIDAFTDALLSATTADEIGRVVREFIATMQAVNPPPDLAKYNQQFVAYLEEALADPTSLVTKAPPLPPDEARRRLAALEPQIAECREPTFFSRGLEPTPAP